MKFLEVINLVTTSDKTNVKLPEWEGYWEYIKDKNTFMIHTKDGKIMDVRESEDFLFTIRFIVEREDWQIADLGNCTIIKKELTEVYKSDKKQEELPELKFDTTLNVEQATLTTILRQELHPLKYWFNEMKNERDIGHSLVLYCEKYTTILKMIKTSDCNVALSEWRKEDGDLLYQFPIPNDNDMYYLVNPAIINSLLNNLEVKDKARQQFQEFLSNAKNKLIKRGGHR